MQGFLTILVNNSGPRASTLPQFGGSRPTTKAAYWNDTLFTDLTKPGQRALWATWTFGLMQVGFALVHVYQNVVINRFIEGSVGIDALSQSDGVVGFAAIGSIFVILCAFAVNGRFLYLASRNAQLINDDPKAITPGWFVGWYFVPIANLWMPFTAMKQTWGRLFPSQSDTPQWLAIWWFSWVGMNIFDRILSRMAVPDNLPDYLTYNNAFMVSGVLWLVPTYFFLRIIREVTAAEHNPAEVFA